jgi:hypothetical protein
VVVCVKDPDVPVKVTVAFASAALAAAENEICCGVPGTSVMLVGDTVTPAGTPVT